MINENNLNKLKGLIVLLIALTVLEVVMVSGEMQSLPPQVINQCVQIVQSHPNATSINVTKISYPSSCNFPINYTIIPMITDNNINYYFNFCNTSCLGDYVVTTCGNGDGKFNCVDYDFEITATGSNLSTGQSIIYFISLILSVIFFCFTLYFSIAIPFKNTRDDDGRIISINKLKYLKLFLMAITYVVLIFIFGITQSITHNFLFASGISNLFNFGYQILLTGLLIVPPLIFIGIIVFLVEDKILYKKIKRGGFFR